MFGCYRDYHDKSLNYRDITFSIIAQPYNMVTYKTS